MRLYEMQIDEANLFMGVNAISLVEEPAIMSDFVALSKQSKEVRLSEMDADKQILIGCALIPNKPIYRNQNGEEFYIYFSEDTVRKSAELFFKNHRQEAATLEHAQPIEGVHIFESWIVEDEVHDKSRKYGLDAPIGSWCVTMKVNDDSLWKEYVKNGKVLGFSIEGQFANSLASDIEMSKEDKQIADALNKVKDILTDHFNK